MRASTIRACLSTLEACSRDVKRWFAENNILLNANKSEVMMIGTPAQLRAASTVDTVAVADDNLTFVKTETARCDTRFQAVVRRPRRNGVQDVQLSHLGASAHPPTTTTRRGANTGLLHRRRKAGLL